MDKKDEIIALREQGCTIRDISQKTGVPRSTVHNILKSSQEQQQEEEEEEEEVIQCQGQKGLLFHLPFTYFCPECGKEQRHAWLCPVCAKFLPAECDGDNCWRAEFDLSEIKRGPYKLND